MEMEDDLFFADLSKQISLLVMDEDDIVVPPPPFPSYPPQDSYSVTASTQTRLHRHQQPQQQPGHVQEKNHHCTREIISKGTGVFIPRFAQPRRRKRLNHHHHLTRQSSSFPYNYTRQQQQQHHDYGTKRLPQEDSMANYFH